MLFAKVTSEVDDPVGITVAEVDTVTVVFAPAFNDKLNNNERLSRIDFCAFMT